MSMRLRLRLRLRLKLILVLALTFFLFYSATAMADVQVVIDSRPSNDYWRKCANVMKKVITDDDESFIVSNNFFQVEILADENGQKIATKVVIYERGKVFREICFKPLVFTEKNFAQTGEVMGRVIRLIIKKLEQAASSSCFLFYTN